MKIEFNGIDVFKVSYLNFSVAKKEYKVIVTENVSDDDICIEDEDGNEVDEDTTLYESLIEKTNEILKTPTQPSKLFARQCDCCGKGMNQGYCINGGEKYFCSDACLTMTYDLSEQKDMGIGDDDSDSYWTEWSEDYQYQEINGVLTEIEEE